MKTAFDIFMTFVWLLCLFGVWSDYVAGKPTIWAPLWATGAIIATIVNAWSEA